MSPTSYQAAPPRIDILFITTNTQKRMPCQVEYGIQMQVVENWSSASIEIYGFAQKLVEKNRLRQGNFPCQSLKKMELEIRVFAIWIAEKRGLVAQFI